MLCLGKENVCGKLNAWQKGADFFVKSKQTEGKVMTFLLHICFELYHNMLVWTEHEISSKK